MLQYSIEDTTLQDLYLTLNENQSTTEPIYSFKFVHILTKQEVTFLKHTTDDKSFWPERYNLFQIKPAELFTELGEWHFFVTEQQTGIMLEQGILLMTTTNKFSYTSYNAGTSFKAYRG